MENLQSMFYQINCPNMVFKHDYIIRSNNAIFKINRLTIS